MFLKCNRRFKDGKEHRYWSIVESRRCVAGEVVQRSVLYLGEINDSQRESWCRTIEAFDPQRDRTLPLAIFPADRPLPEHAAGLGVQVHLDRMELHRPRQWGACWLACQLYEQLGLDRFWAERLPDSREGTCWHDILQTLVCYRLIEPGSEWRLHRLWFEESAMGDLLGRDYALVEKNALYRTLDKRLEHKPALFSHLQERWRDWFGAKFDIWLYDLTSTYFESVPPEDEHDKRRFGYSRDKRPDCVQVVIALIVTPEGFPLADEVMPGNTADQTTLKEFLQKIEAAFKNLKDDLAVRPIYHQLEHRVEAHIFVAFIAYCLPVTLRARLRPLAGGLTPRAVLDKFAVMQMLDVHSPTTDGRTLILSRYTQPQADQKILLARLGLNLPAQPPPRITAAGQLLR